MTWKSILLSCAFFVALPNLARAEPPVDFKEPSNIESGLGRTDHDGSTKAKAYAWSILGTAAPIVIGLSLSSNGGTNALAPWLVVGGMLLGPSSGQFYAQAPGAGALGIGVRTVGGMLFIGGVVAMLDGICVEIDHNPDEPGSSKRCPDRDGGGSAAPLMIAGSLVYLGGTLYSFFDAGWAVDRLRYHPSESQFGWTPTLDLGTSGSTRTGVSAWMRF
jgi:hypothetical protein